jgi:hypothetical protein
MKLIPVAELVGVACIAAFAFFVWPPACLLVVGTALLVATWQASRRPPS